MFISSFVSISVPGFLQSRDLSFSLSQKGKSQIFFKSRRCIGQWAVFSIFPFITKGSSPPAIGSALSWRGSLCPWSCTVCGDSLLTITGHCECRVPSSHLGQFWKIIPSCETFLWPCQNSKSCAQSFFLSHANVDPTNTCFPGNVSLARMVVVANIREGICGSDRGLKRWKILV